MIRLRRSMPWLVAIGSMITFALVTASTSVAVQITLLGLFAAAVAGTLFNYGGPTRQLFSSLLSRSNDLRASPQAREAIERARSLGSLDNPDIRLIDIGLIALQSGPEGMAMRRTRSVSRDDDGIRPFLTLQVGGHAAERSALIRFEVFDHHGEKLFRHEMRSYLRAGRMNVLSEHHLPLARNDSIEGSGDWDLHVYVNDELVGLYGFVLSPSVADRRRRLAGSRSAARRGAASAAHDVPISLRDLIEQSEPDSQRRRPR